ncbi:type IV toxin-antitoxin system AbiEi family antitoxin domain-containing protein [Tersicoccus sp. MR15.9]|uniref:type IV toxin-antitoxin system AbiEi family antitoxin domain-containing protein n=1 Tax=Tersicoccus mangrovi TaxID=3121635 RepID=UPI002FE5A98C
MDVRELGRRHGGVVRWRELREIGLSAAGIALLVKDGALASAGHGVYALPGADPAVVALRLAGGRLTCVSRARALGLWVLAEPERPHVGVLRTTAMPGCVVHRVTRDQSLVDLLRQCCRCLPELEALAIVESAVVQRRVSWDHLRLLVGDARSSRERQVVDQVNPASASILETVGRYRLTKAGFHVHCQVVVPGGGRYDFLVNGVLYVEVDGAGFHSDRQSYRNDRRRWNLLTVRGLPLLSVPFEMVMYEPEVFVRLVGDAVRRHRVS